jgi:Rrf2 family protein
MTQTGQGLLRLSANVDYALRALVELAAAPVGTLLPARVIAERQHIPASFLNHILGELRRGGLVDARRGVGGGWALAREPSEVSVADALAAMNRGVTAPVTVVTDGVRDIVGVAVDSLWRSLRASIDGVVAATTLVDLLQSAVASPTSSKPAVADGSPE